MPRLHFEERAPLDRSERRVVRQFVEALLFEGFATFVSSPRVASGSARAEVYDKRLQFEVGGRRYACFGTIGAFGRVRIQEGSIFRLLGNQEHEVDVFDFVSALDLGAESHARLGEELAQTTAISRLYWGPDLSRSIERRELGFEELEGAIVEGHQYHPTFKSRTGFSLRDQADFGGESGRAFQLHYLAIFRREMRIALPTNEGEFWAREMGAGPYRDLMARLEHLGKNPHEYVVVPTHPFQLRAIQRKGLARAVREGRVVPLGPAGDFYRGTQSLRTLTNATDKTKANVKLPLDVHCTSCRRNLRKHFVCTAPALSDWLCSIVDEDPFLHDEGHIGLLREYAGVLWDPSLDEGVQSQDSELLEGAIGALFRESVSATLASGEAAVPFTALALEESDGHPFVSKWLANSGIEAWVARLIEVTVIPIWHMLVHHGVAFEAHAQNLILVHRDGWPERIVLRDFHEDTEFVSDFLRDPEGAPDFAAIDPYFATVPDDDGYRMGSTEDLRQLYMDTVYVFNLTEVSFLLHRHGILSEARFWQHVRRALDDYSASGVTDPARIARLACDRARVTVESLLKKTTERGRTLDFFAHEVRNTLGSR